MKSIINDVEVTLSVHDTQIYTNIYNTSAEPGHTTLLPQEAEKKATRQGRIHLRHTFAW